METPNNNAISAITLDGTNITGTISCTWYPLDLRSEEKKLEPEKIIYSNRTTIVFWNDGTRTQSTASLSEISDPEVGFAMCLLKKLYGKKIYGKPLYRRMINRAEVQEGAEDMMAEYRFSLNLKKQEDEKRGKKRGKRK